MCTEFYQNRHGFVEVVTKNILVCFFRFIVYIHNRLLISRPMMGVQNVVRSLTHKDAANTLRVLSSTYCNNTAHIITYMDYFCSAFCVDVSRFHGKQRTSTWKRKV